MSTRGFTLVELLVVLSIVGLLSALVAPSVGKQWDRARAQEEWLVVQRTVEGLSFRAFTEGRGVTILARGKSLEWTFSGRTVESLRLDYLFFHPQQTIEINSNGVASADDLQVRQADRVRILKLNQWANETS
jgi:prepilin-type N-terminal cleavage/methylation domain-containing protein